MEPKPKLVGIVNKLPDPGRYPPGYNKSPYAQWVREQLLGPGSNYANFGRNGHEHGEKVDPTGTSEGVLFQAKDAPEGISTSVEPEHDILDYL